MTDFDSFNIKTLIPLAVGSMLIASGCSAEGSVGRKWCKNFKECNEDAFDDTFDSVAECTKLVKLQAKASNYALEIEEDAECAATARKMQTCYARQLTCDAFPTKPSDYDDTLDWVEDSDDECEDQLDDYEKECDTIHSGAASYVFADLGGDYYYY